MDTIRAGNTTNLYEKDRNNPYLRIGFLGLYFRSVGAKQAGLFFKIEPCLFH